MAASAFDLGLYGSCSEVVDVAPVADALAVEQWL